MRGVVLLEHLGNPVPRQWRHGRLVDHDQRAVHGLGDGRGRRLDVGEIRLPTLALRRADSDDRELGARHRVPVGRREVEPAGGGVALHQLAQARLVERHRPAPQERDLFLVDVDDRDVVAEVGQAGGRRQPDIPGADDRDPAHGGGIISIRIHTQRWWPAPSSPS